jgi:hypothetical protein
MQDKRVIAGEVRILKLLQSAVIWVRNPLSLEVKEFAMFFLQVATCDVCIAKTSRSAEILQFAQEL